MSNDLSLANALGVTNPQPLASTVTVVKSAPKGRGRHKDPIAKNEDKLLGSNGLNVEDGAATAFDIEARGQIVSPTYDPILLALLTQHNNTLLQCLQAMSVNIDGTGYEIERADGEPLTDDDKKKVLMIKQFFDEPYPGESLITQRRAMRHDIESVGWGCLEVIRNEGGDIVFLRRLDAKLMRLVKLDKPAKVEKVITRMGKETTVVMFERERRYAMQVGSKLRFFREFGSSRQVDMLTGAWLTSDGYAEAGTEVIDPARPKMLPKMKLTATKDVLGLHSNKPAPTGVEQAAGETLPKPRRGTEVIWLGAVPDVGTGYSVPRWINQIPSVLGSRKAEEFNLEFFNSGGLPPALVLVQGGQLSAESRKELTNYLAGKAKFKQRGVIAEVHAIGGDISGNGGSVKVTVERFGDEKQKDSMFGNYDARCSDRVRMAFRLPQLFLGNSQDQNFATAYASYMVAEAQVFRPEREEFDEVINVKVMRELAPEYIFRSLPLQINDVQNQLKALELSKGVADPEEWIKTMNEVASMTLTLDPEYNSQPQQVVNEMSGRPADADPDAVVEVNKRGKIKKMSDDLLTDLADDLAAHATGTKAFTEDQLETMQALLKSLTPQLRNLVRKYVAVQLVGGAMHDPEGSAELLEHAGTCLTPAA